MRVDLKPRIDINGLPFFDVYINGQYQGSYTNEKRAIEEKKKLLKGVCV